MSFNLQTRNYKELVDVSKIDKLITGLLGDSISLTRFLNKNKEKTKQDLITQLVNRLNFYKKKASKKNLVVRYDFTIPNYGRVYASGKYISMGSFPREIRSTLAADNYVDIDINNCHPTLAVQLCDKFNIQCDELRNYVNNRNDYLKKCIEEFNCDRDAAKVLFLQIMYGGSYSSWSKNYGVEKECPDWVKKFDKNVKSIYDKLLEKFADDVKYLQEHGKPEKEHNKIGACVSWILQNEECKILDCMLNYISSYGKSVGNCILCFDGFMMLKNKYTPDLLEKLENHIYKQLNYKVKLSVKPFTDAINLDGITADVSSYDSIPAPKTNYYDHDVMINSLNRNYDIGKEYFERYHAYDETTNKIVYANLYLNKVEFLSKEELKFRYSNLWYEDENCTSKKFIEAWIDDHSRRYVRQVEELPYNDVFTEDNIFPIGKYMNTFTGFNKHIHDELTDEQLQEGNKWFENIFMDTLIRLCEGNKDYAYWLLCFFAQIVQYPADRKDRAVIIVGEQGNGKNSILEAIAKVIGSDHYSTSSDPTSYFGEHAIEHAHKLLCNFDESSCRNAEKFAEQLKTFITTNTIEINEKYVKQYKIKNYARIIATSNKTTALPVDFRSGDRRFVMFQANDFMINGIKYEANSHEHTQYFNDFYHVINSDWFPSYFYKKLMSVDISNWDYNKKFDTKLKSDMMEYSKNSVELFLDEFDFSEMFKNNDVTYSFLESMNIEYDKKCFYCRISVKDLFEHYKNYCNECNLTPISKIKFVRSIKEYKELKYFFVYFYKSHGCMTFIVNRSAYKRNIVCEFDEDCEEINWED